MSQRKPAATHLAFIVALAFEMFGIPLSMYVVAWVFGFHLPEGVFWGHTLVGLIGIWGYYISLIFYAIGLAMIVSGWSKIHKHYWSKEEGKGSLVTTGIYRYIRHPQYTGFLLITFGMLCEWATIPLLVMWPILLGVYYRLAKREEADMEREFGASYLEYQQHTRMLLPRVFR